MLVWSCSLYFSSLKERLRRNQVTFINRRRYQQMHDLKSYNRNSKLDGLFV